MTLVLVLVATDAAGEGVNLQNANLMVNYDLPWNPNRLEQRFICAFISYWSSRSLSFMEYRGESNS